jgi:hypothetical protein
MSDSKISGTNGNKGSGVMRGELLLERLQRWTRNQPDKVG